MRLVVTFVVSCLAVVIVMGTTTGRAIDPLGFALIAVAAGVITVVDHRVRARRHGHT